VQEYFRLRSQAVAQLKQTDEHPYPHKFHVSISLAEFIDTYNNISDGEILEGTEVSVAGSYSFLFLLYKLT
jgi:lysyl-tRNA synthetase class 2